MARRADVDVLVLGAGASGLAAALAARALGASVLVLEAQSAEAHTPNVRMSGGWVMTVTGAGDGAAYLAACAGGLVSEARTGDWAARSTGLETWLRSLGVELWSDGVVREPEHPALPGSQAIAVRRATSDLPAPIPAQRGWWAGQDRTVGGEALYRGLLTAAGNSGVEIAWATKAESLARGVDGDVVGVRLEDGGVVAARGGVVVATGGFGASPDLVRNHCTVPDTRFYGNPGNDGGGLRLAASAGAGIARMNRLAGRGIASFDVDGRQLGFMVDMTSGGYVICDRSGRRYGDESPQAALHHDVFYAMEAYDARQACYPRSPSYYVFDRRRFESGPLTYPERGACGVGLYEWSRDNAVELERGWIGRGATPSEAAAAVGAPLGASFDRTVAEYNDGCARRDDAFGRPVASLVPLDSPPYYCVPLHVGGPNTTGGPERDERGRVLSALDGSPVPGLYGAGELGQAIGMLYPSAGCSLSEALCSGLSAGEAAAGRAAS